MGHMNGRPDKVAGHLRVGINHSGKVVVNLDHEQTGHIVFSPDQARHLASLLNEKADDAEGHLLRN